MNILLSVIYGTSFGEELVLNLITGIEDGIRQSTAYRMRTVDGREWTCNLKLDLKKGTHIDYFYSVVRGEDNVVRREWLVEPHRLEINALRGDSITVYDHWIDMPDDAYLYTSAFTDCIRRRKTRLVPLSDYPVTVRLKVRAPQLSGRQVLKIVGADECLGAWDVLKAVPMVEHNYNEWLVDIDATRLRSGAFYFKFVAVDVADAADAVWESCDNRRVELPLSLKDGGVRPVAIFDNVANAPSSNNGKQHGTAAEQYGQQRPECVDSVVPAINQKGYRCKQHQYCNAAA